MQKHGKDHKKWHDILLISSKDTPHSRNFNSYPHSIFSFSSSSWVSREFHTISFIHTFPRVANKNMYSLTKNNNNNNRNLSSVSCCRKPTGISSFQVFFFRLNHSCRSVLFVAVVVPIKILTFQRRTAFFALFFRDICFEFPLN